MGGSSNNEDFDGDSCSGSPALHELIVFGAVKYCLKVVVCHLILADCIKAMKDLLSLGCPVVALACKRCNRKYLDSRKYAGKSYTTHLCAGCGSKWDVSP